MICSIRPGFGSEFNSSLLPAARCLLPFRNDDVAILVHGGFLFGVNHGCGVELFDDRRPRDPVAGLKPVAAVNRRCQRAVLSAEEDIARAGLCFLDLAPGSFPR